MGDPEGHAATRVLVVDDEPSIRLLCRVNLELDGHEVLEASSLATAREELEREDVDVVVLVTGSVEITDSGLSEADAILPEPFELEQLLSTVRNLAHAHAHR